MGGESTSGGWWKTLPGVLTAVAALITALIGGVVGLRQAGILFTGAASPDQVNVTGAERSRVPYRPVPDPSPGGTPSSSALPSVAPELDQVRVGSEIYRILSAKVESYDATRLTLRLEVRCTNEGRYPTNFWSSSFRLLIDDVPQAPEGLLNEIVEGGAAKEAEVAFVVPRTTRSLALKVIRGDRDALLPLRLDP